MSKANSGCCRSSKIGLKQLKVGVGKFFAGQDLFSKFNRRFPRNLGIGFEQSNVSFVFYGAVRI